MDSEIAGLRGISWPLIETEVSAPVSRRIDARTSEFSRTSDISSEWSLRVVPRRKIEKRTTDRITIGGKERF
tara:strand:- start:306 stop:521 length:216 start_codon:yes stop_codon:yes gene_type:complete